MNIYRTKFCFNKRSIDALPNSDKKQTEYSDTEVSGLKLIVTAKGNKSFLFRYTFQSTKQSIKIGDYVLMDVKKARQKALEMKQLLSQGINPQAEKDRCSAMPTFKEFCEKTYIPHAKQHKRSYQDDISKLNTHMYAHLGSLRLGDITYLKIDAYLNHLGKDKKLADATYNRHLALLSVIFNLAITHGLLEKNPCAHIKKLKENNQRDRYLSPDELKRLLAVMDDTNPQTCEPNRITVAALKLLLLTGTRREEALSAKWKDIDLNQKRWFLPHTKSGKSRYVQLNRSACKLLSSIKPVQGCPYVFVNPKTKTRINTPVKTFKRLLEKAQITNFRIHDLRHHFASVAVNSGASLYVVQNLLGHASSQTTQRYAHLQSETLLAASEKVAQAMR